MTAHYRKSRHRFAERLSWALLAVGVTGVLVVAVLRSVGLM